LSTRIVGGLAAALLLVGCAEAGGPGSPAQRQGGGASNGPAAQASSAPGASCHARQVGTGPGDWEPDPHCTPGAANPRVSQGNLQQTVCVAGWSSRERKRYAPQAYTESLKKQSIAAYGYADTNPRNYEEDHLWAIEDGGDPQSALNLWAQPALVNDKDQFENFVHRQLCSGHMTLAEAGHELTTDWHRYWVTAGRPTT